VHARQISAGRTNGAVSAKLPVLAAHGRPKFANRVPQCYHNLHDKSHFRGGTDRPRARIQGRLPREVSKMSEQGVLTYWAVGLGTATAVACLAAVLLIANLRMAQKIERSTGAALEVIQRIRERTELETEAEKANQATCQLNMVAESFLAHTEAIQPKQAVANPNKSRKENGR
jgi:hypothetical protein